MTCATENEQTEPAVPAADAVPADGRLTGLLLGLCVVLALAIVFFACLMPIPVTDFWWQLRTGEIIVRTGTIPRTDPFSWTAHGQPWLVHEWLTEVLFYWAYTSLPNWVLLLYKAGLAVVACALVLARGWARSGSLVLGIGAALAAGYVVRNYADLRPQMITFVLLAGTLLALDEYRQGRLPLLPWALPAVFALWANLHGGVVVGLTLVALWTVGEAVGCALARGEGRLLPALGLAVVASALTVALNPNGFLVYAYPFQVLGHPRVMDYITEWWSPNFHLADMRAFEFLLLGTFAVTTFAARLPTVRRRGGYGDLFILTAMAHAALITQRNTAPFALAAAPVLAEGLGDLWRAAVRPAFRGSGPAEAAWRRLRRWPGTRPVLAAALAGVLGVMLYRQVPRLPPSRWFESAISWHSFPLQAVAKMKQGAWPGALYNDYVWGGFLIWELYPERPVAIDGRAEVYYPTGAFDDEMRIHNTWSGWDETLDRRHVQVVLTERNGALAGALSRSPKWTLAFTGEVEAVYTRAAPGP